jgi:hypothetical protein
MLIDTYQDVIEGCGGRVETLANKERWDWIQRWREVFATGIYESTGHWKLGQFEWEIFVTQVRAMNGPRASLAYAVEQSLDFIVCPESPDIPAVHLFDADLPDFRSMNKDMYVWPSDLAWTMAFTHEESIGMGPYFCRREWVVAGSRGRSRRRTGRA